MVRDTSPSQDAPTHLWDSYLKEYKRYAPDTKWDSRRTVRLLYNSQGIFGGIKIRFADLNKLAV